MKIQLLRKTLFISFLLLVPILSSCFSPDHLDPPQVIAIAPVVGKYFIVRGIGYPSAKISIYVDDKFVDYINVSEKGEILDKISVPDEGPHTIKFNQTYCGVNSSMTPAQNFIVDLTPPSLKISIVTNLPQFTSQLDWMMEGTSDPNTKINGLNTVSDEQGKFKVALSLSEGLNVIKISLEDSVGNATDIIREYKVWVDNQKPQFTSGFCSSLDANNQILSKEIVCLKHGDFHSYTGVYSIPFTGWVRGNIKSITLNNRQIRWDQDGQINQVISMALRFGTNNLPVRIVDMVDNVTNSILPIEIVRDKDSENQEILDRLDDIEMQINDIE